MGKQRMIWDSNDEIGAMQEKYSLIFLNIDCDRKLSENKKLPTNAWIVTYLDKKKDSDEVKESHDIVMGIKMDVFNCYYDKLRDGTKLKEIGWCQGNCQPNLFDQKSYLKTSK